MFDSVGRKTMDDIRVITLIGVGCMVPIALLVYGIVRGISDSISEKRAQKRLYQEQKQREILQKKSEYEELMKNFDKECCIFFNTYRSSYFKTYDELVRLVNAMRRGNEELKAIPEIGDYSSTIAYYSLMADDFYLYGKKARQLPISRMIDTSSYGKIQKIYWDSVRNLKKNDVDVLINDYDLLMKSGDFERIKAIDVEMVLRIIWFYATEKPFSAQCFEKAVDIFYLLVENDNIDVKIAELYAMKQMGGEEAIRENIQNEIKKYDRNAEGLTVLASALMWLDAYRTENMVLQHMLKNKMQMSMKMQERLHALTNGGGTAPSVFDVTSNNNTLFFDVTSLAWKDEEYNGFLENLAFQERVLSYSLAIRDEDKELFTTFGINVPKKEAILDKLISVFAVEYGDCVAADIVNCVALSGIGEEQIQGILIETRECKQLGILVYLVKIGKKINIKFYTLFMPSQAMIADQKQQVLSLYKKLSPSVTMWESSLKDTTLMAIQQILNLSPQGTIGGSVSPVSDDEPIF